MIAILLLLPADTPDEFFEKKIRPALVANCLSCHDTQKQRGGLRLDSRAAMLKGGDTGPALVPGDVAKSRIITAIGYKEIGFQMPPRGKLSDAVIADLTKWVAEGAHWPAGDKTTAAQGNKFDLADRKAAHWSWQPLRDPVIPAPKDDWARSASDRLLLADLDKSKLSPAPDTDRSTLLRRLSFDLIGLPPVSEEVEAFIADRRPDAVERVVDRLLANPRFGERWARHWLDLVRYAETRGHEFDFSIPNAYRYRDYVIRALNDDVPYDRFVIEHLAGDLVSSPRTLGGSNESILGTGFWFLGEEVHSPVDIRADQADRFDNRIDVMSKTFLGLTISCARCHDHKFDAISSRDYYSLYSFLTSSSYRQVRYDGWETNRAVAARLDTLRAEHARRMPAFEYTPPVDTAQGEVIVDYANLKPGQWLPDDVSFGIRPAKAGELRLGRVVERTAAEFDPFWSPLNYAPGSEQEPGGLGANRSGRTIRTPGFKVAPGRVYALVRGAGRLYAGVGSHIMLAGPLHGRLVQGFGASKTYRWVAIDLSLYVGQPAHLELTANSDDFAVARVIQSTTVPPAPTEAKLPILDDKTFVEWRTAEQGLAKEAVFSSRLAPAMQDGTGIDEAVFVRGSHRNLGTPTPRRFLEALAGDRPLVTPGSGRMELAKQMVDPSITPLTSRVMVNRVWHHLFGRGIAASVDDLGVMGTPPTHPELLDHLATRFAKEGWSVKRLVRELVLSRAYAMSSDPTADDKTDPDNRLFHRANVRRLSAEAVRDALLSLSGELRPTMFGSPTPIYLTEFQEGRGRPGSGPLNGDGRRSIYLGVRRNFLSSFLLAFDAPAPFSAVGRRTVSNVPAQSLIMMNDPFVQQQSALWAKRGGDARRLYLAAFGRLPTADEMSVCEAFLKEGTPEELAHSLVNVKEFIFVR